jgi:hypothetical protein
MESCCDVYREGSVIIADEKLIAYESMECVPSSDLMLDDMLDELVNFAFPGQPLAPPSPKFPYSPLQADHPTDAMLDELVNFAFPGQPLAPPSPKFPYSPLQADHPTDAMLDDIYSAYLYQKNVCRF